MTGDLLVSVLCPPVFSAIWTGLAVILRRKSSWFPYLDAWTYFCEVWIAGAGANLIYDIFQHTILTVMDAASLLLAIWLRQRRPPDWRRACKLAGAKGRALIAGLVRTLHEHLQPAPVSLLTATKEGARARARTASLH